jgi:hypothetical protein
VESEYGDFGVCVGIPTFGATSDDYSKCTKDDRCKVVIAADGLFRGVCAGGFQADMPCNDYDDECTIKDRSKFPCSLLYCESMPKH